MLCREIQHCCKYRRTPESKSVPPEYRNEFNCGRKYSPSYNIAPTDITPVLASAIHFDDQAASTERVIVPMMWSMVPSWHKGDYRRHGLTTNNCRLEGLVMSKLYSPPLNAGQRCVILCEGFYEWQTTKKDKASERQAFFVHMPQNEAVRMEDKSTWNLSKGGITLLKIAGLFDIWVNENGDKLYSYTIITFESNEKFSTIHHRIPAILETEEEVTAWLDFRHVGVNQALNMLKPSDSIQWYAVSNLVNNSRNKSEQCNKPISHKESEPKSPTKGKNKIMQSWLIVQKRNTEEPAHENKTPSEEPPEKKQRPDDEIK
ncbi:abasic site processing protein HMCES [Sabethes cyaneus]|uniref:abasic site processing protein HMCES n=1 Tax=Sabethes cyaneus TaxID=53552 RepID=UPI00237E9CC6|nr:abasic site processing protein HMCES [Sabethes cyaneus]